MSRFLRLALASSALLQLASSAASAAAYSLTIVAKAGDIVAGKTLFGIGGSSVINNSGTVVFLATFSGGTGLFSSRPSVGNEGQSTLLVETGETIGGQTLIGIGGSMGINNRGTVVFGADFGTPGIFGIVQIDKGQSTLLVKTGDTISGKH